jgi:hypothetical protein
MYIGHEEAAKYDLVTTGQGNSYLSDMNSLRGSTRAHVEFDMIHAKAMLEVMMLGFQMMLGSDHPLVISTESFMAQYNTYRLSIQYHLASHCSDHHKSHFVRYFSIQLTNWFRWMESSSVLLC